MQYAIDNRHANAYISRLKGIFGMCPTHGTSVLHVLHTGPIQAFFFIINLISERGPYFEQAWTSR